MRSNLPFYISILAWTVVLSISLLWNFFSVDQSTQQLVKSIGKSFFLEIETTRLWNASHGGVYVPVTETTRPNPYLEDAGREIRTIDGTIFTKINPAYMTRQIAELAREQNDIQYHITSLQPIRPQNLPDEWERMALQRFRTKDEELLEYLEADDVYKYMAPLMVKPACMQCHEKQGYVVGDIRGGISVTIPAAVYRDAASESKVNLFIIHAAFLMLAIGGSYAFKRYRDRQVIVIEKKQGELEEEINQRRKAEKNLITARDQAEAANSAKSQFLANMSHELRTPFNAILGFSQLMQSSTKLDGEHREYLNIIINSSETLLQLINQVLDLSKIEAGKMELKQHRFDLHKLLDEIIDIFKLSASRKQLQFLFDRAPDIPQFVIGDDLKLRQILVNLLNNSVKFTTEGHVGLSVWKSSGSETDVSGSSVIHFEVEDSGPGIKPEEMDLLFQTFTQTSSGKASLEGTGLGLPISRKFVQMMGGEISVESSPGGFTRFSFGINLPVSEYKPAPEAQVPLAPYLRDYEFSMYRILVVDDRVFNRLLLVKFLSPLGFQIQEAEDGLQAVETWRKWKPHLVWMDLRMPVMDGFEAIRLIRSEEGGDHVKIIVLTASIFDDETTIRETCDCDDFLRKPFFQKDIFEMVSRHLETIDISRNNETGNKEKAENSTTMQETPLKILLVDDVSANTKILRHFLKDLPVVIDEAENGRSALNRVQESEYDLIFMDFEMPVLSGIEAVKEIRKWETENGLSQSTIIGITAGDLGNSDLDIPEFTEIWNKPIKQETVRRRVEAVLAGKADS